MSDIKELKQVVFNVGGSANFQPTDELDNVPEIDNNSFVVLNQGAPIWRYIKAFIYAQNADAGVIATYDTRKKGAVVVASQIAGWNVNDIFDFDIDKKTISLEEDKIV